MSRTDLVFPFYCVLIRFDPKKQNYYIFNKKRILDWYDGQPWLHTHTYKKKPHTTNTQCTHKLLCHLCCYNSTVTMQKPRENSLNSGCFKQKQDTHEDKLLSSVLSCIREIWTFFCLCFIWETSAQFGSKLNLSGLKFISVQGSILLIMYDGTITVAYYLSEDNTANTRKLSLITGSISIYNVTIF